MKRKRLKKVEKRDPKNKSIFDDAVDWLGWDEDSIHQQAYLDELERDLSLGFPRYRRRSP